MSLKEKDKVIQQAIQQINKKYGQNSIASLSAMGNLDIEVVPLECLSLNRVLGCGGLPRGRVIELYGEPGSGKSSLAMYLAAEVQRQGGKALWIDSECAFSSTYAKSFKIKLDELIISQPKTGEEALDMVDTMARTNAIDIIVVDSVAALVPAKELAGEIVDDNIALQARMMSKGLRMITGSVSKSKTVVIFINQMRDKAGMYWGKKTITSGGKALKFYSSVRLEVRRGENLKNEKGEINGNILIIYTAKNKTAAPFKSCEILLRYDQGIDVAADLFQIAVGDRIITKVGNTYSFGTEKLGIGYDKALIFLKNDNKLLAAIRQKWLESIAVLD